MKERIRQFIKRVNRERQLTVLLTSHDLGDIEDLCRRLVMIDSGRIVFDGPLDAIMARFGRDRRIDLVLHEALAEASEIAGRALAGLAPAEIQQPDPHRLSVQFDATEASAAAIAGRLLAVLPVSDFRIEEPTIESIIRQLYEGKLQLAEAT